MTTEGFFLNAPVPLIAALLLIALVGAMQLGICLQRRHLRKQGGAADSGESSQDGYLVSAALGLLALLLGFTFALSIGRHDNRNLLVIREANAIGTTYLRAQLLEEPHRSALSDLLHQYTQQRLALATSTSRAQRIELMKQSDDLQIQLWSETMAAVRPIAGSTYALLLVDAMNSTLDAGAARVAGRRAHVPARVLMVLAMCMAISAFILGHVMARSPRRTTTLVLLGLLTLTYALIIDIDRPVGGAIKEPQEPMQDLLELMRRMPADKP